MAPWDRSDAEGSSVNPCCQLAGVLGEASLPSLQAAEPLIQGAYPLLRPCTCRSSACQGRSHFLEDRNSPWEPVSDTGCLGVLEQGALGGQRARQAALVTGLGNIIFQPSPWRVGLAGCEAVAVGFPWLAG